MFDLPAAHLEDVRRGRGIVKQDGGRLEAVIFTWRAEIENKIGLEAVAFRIDDLLGPGAARIAFAIDQLLVPPRDESELPVRSELDRVQAFRCGKDSVLEIAKIRQHTWDTGHAANAVNTVSGRRAVCK